MNMKKIAVGLLLTGVVWALFNFHFILFDNRIKILTKAHYTLDNTFVDARGAKKIRLLLNPDLAKAGFQDILNEVSQ